MRVYRRSRNGRVRPVREAWVVMRNGEPQATSTYLGGGLGVVKRKSSVPELIHWETTRRQGQRIMLLTGEEPDGTYWEIMRTPLNPIITEGLTK